MINQAGLEVQLSLDDQLTAKLTKSFSAIKESVEKAGQGIKDLGGHLTKAGRDAMFLGAAITGPLAIAFKTASDYSIDAGDSLKNLSAVSIDFQKTIGTALVPVIDKFTAVLKNLSDWFKNLDPTLRTTIVQAALITGVFLVLGGSVLNLTGHLFKLTGALVQFIVANAPLVTVVGILIAIFTYWEQIRNIVIPIVNAVQIAIDLQAIAYEKLALGMTLVLGLAARMAGQTGLAEWFDKQANSIADIIDGLEADMANAMSGKGWGETFSNTVEDIKAKATELQNFFSTVFNMNMSASIQQFGQNFGKTFKDAYDQVTNIGRNSALIMIQQVTMLSNGFGDSAAKMIMEGKNFGESMKQVFKDMATAFISAVLSMMAQWLAFQALKMAFGVGFFDIFHNGGQVYHSGGIVRAHSGLAVDEVPIIAQRGEGILSRKGMNALGGAPALNALNSGKSGAGSVYVTIENASFSTEDAAEETLQRLSRLIEEKGRSRTR